MSFHRSKKPNLFEESDSEKDQAGSESEDEMALLANVDIQKKE